MVPDEVNSLGRLRQSFPKESKFCFAFAPPLCHRPHLGSQPGSAHKQPSGSQLLCPSGNTLARAVEGFLLLLVNDNVWVVGYPILSTKKAITVIFFPFFLFIHSCLQWDHICQAYGRGRVGWNCKHNQSHFINSVSIALWERLRNWSCRVRVVESSQTHVHLVGRACWLSANSGLSTRE